MKEISLQITDERGGGKKNIKTARVDIKSIRGDEKLRTKYTALFKCIKKKVNFSFKKTIRAMSDI